MIDLQKSLVMRRLEALIGPKPERETTLLAYIAIRSCQYFNDPAISRSLCITRHCLQRPGAIIVIATIIRSALHNKSKMTRHNYYYWARQTRTAILGSLGQCFYLLGSYHHTAVRVMVFIFRISR